MSDDVTEIRVAGDPGYPVLVGRGIWTTVADHLAPRVQKVLVVHPPTLAAKAEELRAALGERYQV
ncbi:hypothetical protein, partial [Mesorhizobium japonicum]|uniref:hypothetical protein n=1 Tax=Mesorhizobium japonicum TaxID=2066070 RepID=UPI003B58CA25